MLGDATLARRRSTRSTSRAPPPSRSSPQTTSRTSRPVSPSATAWRALDRGAGRAARVRPPARAPPRAELRLPPRVVDLGDRRAVVRRRGARPGGAVHVLRRQPPVPARAPARQRRRRPRRPGDARAARRTSGSSRSAARRARARSSTRRGATRAWRPTTTPTWSARTPSCWRCCATTASGRSARRAAVAAIARLRSSRRAARSSGRRCRGARPRAAPSRGSRRAPGARPAAMSRCIELPSVSCARSSSAIALAGSTSRRPPPAPTAHASSIAPTRSARSSGVERISPSSLS